MSDDEPYVEHYRAKFAEEDGAAIKAELQQRIRDADKAAADRWVDENTELGTIDELLAAHDRCRDVAKLAVAFVHARQDRAFTFVGTPERTARIAAETEAYNALAEAIQ